MIKPPGIPGKPQKDTYVWVIYPAGELMLVLFEIHQKGAAAPGGPGAISSSRPNGPSIRWPAMRSWASDEKKLSQESARTFKPWLKLEGEPKFSNLGS